LLFKRLKFRFWELHKGLRLMFFYGKCSKKGL
jgi:hypothetical protein